MKFLDRVVLRIRGRSRPLAQVGHIVSGCFLASVIMGAAAGSPVAVGRQPAAMVAQAGVTSPSKIPSDAKLLATTTVPGKGTLVVIGPLLRPNTRYYLIASGVVKTWPSNPNGPSHDAAWCFDGPNYCGANGTQDSGMQITFFDAQSNYRGYTFFGKSTNLPYNPQHTYTAPVTTPAFPARIKLSLVDSQPEDNEGALTVSLYGVPATDTDLSGPLELEAVCGGERAPSQWRTVLTCNRYAGAHLKYSWNKGTRAFPLNEAKNYPCCRLQLEQSPGSFSERPLLCVDDSTSPSRVRIYARNCVIHPGGAGGVNGGNPVEGNILPPITMHYQVVLINKQRRERTSNPLVIKWVGPTRPPPNFPDYSGKNI